MFTTVVCLGQKRANMSAFKYANGIANINMQDTRTLLLHGINLAFVTWFVLADSTLINNAANNCVLLRYSDQCNRKSIASGSQNREVSFSCVVLTRKT